MVDFVKKLSLAICGLCVVGNLSGVVVGDASAEESLESVDFYGEQVDGGLAEDLERYAEEEGIDLEEEFQEVPVTRAGQSSANGLSFYRSSQGGITVPPGYIYDPRRGALHDYCTNSPDQFPAPGENADFSGACARHDMCYERTSRSNKNGMRTCDSNLRNDLMRVCEAVYTSNFDPRRNSCRTTALGYYNAVVAFHAKNYWPF